MHINEDPAQPKINLKIKIKEINSNFLSKACYIHSPLAHLFVPSLFYLFWAIFILLPFVSPLHGSALKDNYGACFENSRLEAKLLQILQILLCSSSPFVCCVCVG